MSTSAAKCWKCQGRAASFRTTPAIMFYVRRVKVMASIPIRAYKIGRRRTKMTNHR